MMAHLRRPESRIDSDKEDRKARLNTVRQSQLATTLFPSEIEAV